jgi:RNA polymerase sigma factor (sigma-70 family)
MSTRAAWFAEHILPIEPKVRAWLRKAGWTREEIEDLVQESYARLAAQWASGGVEISQPAAYMFRTVRNAAADNLRRKRIVSIRSVADMSRLDLRDEALDPEQELSAHEDLAQLRAAIDRLPRQCRAVFVLRKVEGLSQAETAKRLGMSQSTIEKYVARGMRQCAAFLTRPTGDTLKPKPAEDTLSGQRRDD